jgi:hypothetical protein
LQRLVLLVLLLRPLLCLPLWLLLLHAVLLHQQQVVQAQAVCVLLLLAQPWQSPKQSHTPSCSLHPFSN